MIIVFFYNLTRKSILKNKNNRMTISPSYYSIFRFSYPPEWVKGSQRKMMGK